MQSRNHRSNSVSECMQGSSNGRKSYGASLYSSPGPNSRNEKQDNMTSPLLSLDRTFTSSPIIAFASNTVSSGANSVPGTPVDIRSVPQVRQLSCKKLIYSYTFGSDHLNSNLDESMIDPHSNHHNHHHLYDSSNRSPTSNCRQSYHHKATSTLLSDFVTPQKRKH